MIAYTTLTEPQKMFFDINSKALITAHYRQRWLDHHGCLCLRMVKPGKMTTIPAEEIAL